MPQSAANLETSAFQRILVLGIPRAGKTTTCAVSLTETYGNGYVVVCGDKSSLEPAARRVKGFEFDIVRDESDMETVLQLAREGIAREDNPYKWVMVDDLTIYADWLESSLKEASIRQQQAKGNPSAEPNGMRVYNEYKTRLCNLAGRFCDLKCHVVFTGHYQEAPSAMSAQRKRPGVGVWPMLTGQAAQALPLRFRDVIFLEKEEGGRRVFTINPTGVFTPAGCRSIDKDDLIIEASFEAFEQAQKENIIQES